jgi:hypothetical protein
LVYNLEKAVWNRIALKTESRSLAVSRACHSSVIVNNKIYIFGGFSKKYGFLNDICIITLIKNDTSNSEMSSSFLSSNES